MIFDRAIKNEAREIITLDDPTGWKIGVHRSIGQSGAMKLSAVNACVECITNSLSKLPVYAMNRHTKERVEHPVLQLLTDRPNEAMTPSVYKKLVEANRLLCGNGYAVIVRSRANAKPVELLPVPAQCMTPKVDDSGKLWYLFSNPCTGELRRLDQYDVLHYKAYSEDGINGISVLARASEVIGTARATQEYERRFYAKNAQPAGILSVKSSLGKEAKDIVRTEWEKLHSGVDNAFRIAVLDMGMDFKPISISNADAQFVESKAVSVEDIARFFGVPLYKINAGKQSYSSNEQNSIEYVVNTLHPAVTQYEEENTFKLLFDSDRARGLELRINMMAELRGDNASRANWYQTMWQTGAFSVNDILALEDMPGVEGGDTHNASLNYVPLKLFEELSRNRNGGKE